MTFGMSDEQYELLEKLVIHPLKQKGCKVYIFGSRTGSAHHSHSDVDILFSKPDNTPLPAGFISTITESIEESRFPFIVDLVDEGDLAQSYRPSVLASRVEV